VSSSVDQPVSVLDQGGRRYTGKRASVLSRYRVSEFWSAKLATQRCHVVEQFSINTFMLQFKGDISDNSQGQVA
jgi:hypothetical protein